MFNALAQLRFGVTEILSLIGLVQCVYVLVYMAFRAGSWPRAVLPFCYFLVLGLAFFTGFAENVFGDGVRFYHLIEWALWFLGPPLSVLLMIQIARITDMPLPRHYCVLLLLPAALVAGSLLAKTSPDCLALTGICPGLEDWLTLTGLLAGAISLFAMWSQRTLLTQLQSQPGGRDRYWLIISLVIANLFFLLTMLVSLTSLLTPAAAGVIRTIWGLGFVYLAGTSLFRIYPQAVKLAEKGGRGPASPDDQDLAKRIEDLLNLQKVYHEPAYNRVNLAKELDVSEAAVSRVINQHFGKTLPQLFNERRVADARRLLAETAAPIKTIAEEVGFNSIASFNRVFKDIAGISPGQYRIEAGKARE